VTATDPGAPLARVDSLDLWAHTAAMPEQLASAASSVQAAGHLDLGTVEHLAVLGVGPSALAASVLQAFAAPSLAVPITAVHADAVPASLGPGTIAFAYSYSGETQDTLDVAQVAWDRGVRIVAVTSGGRLGALAREHGSPVLGVPAGIPQSRTALGAMAVAPLLALEAAGVLSGAGRAVEAAAAQLARRRDELAAGGGIAADVARRIGRTIPLVQGAAGFGSLAARRWKSQVNANAKAPAFASELPGLCHDEIAGWGQHGDVTRQVFTVVQLRMGDDAPATWRRFELERALIDEVVGDVLEVTAQGQGPLAGFFDLAFVGDYVSLHLAAHEGVDPGPVPASTELTRMQL
jgi:glucose/mannose-6-phosphate isomerase